MIQPTGATSVSVDVQIVSDAGLPVAGLVAATFPPVSYSLAGPQAAVGITLSDLAAVTSPWSSGGVKERSGGYYRLDLPDAALAVGGTVRVEGEATGKHLLCSEVQVGAVASSAAEVRDAVGMATANLDAQLNSAAGILTLIDSEASAAASSAAATNARLPASPAAVGDAMTLTAGERTAVATAWGARVIGNGRTADYFLQGGLNKVSFDVPTVGKVTIFHTDDSTPLNVADYTASAPGTPPVASFDPA